MCVVQLRCDGNEIVTILKFREKDKFVITCLRPQEKLLIRKFHVLVLQNPKISFNLNALNRICLKSKYINVT